MKKLLLSVAALLAISTAFAQEDEIRFGAKAGLNLSNLAGDFDSENDTKVGFHVGGVVEIPITDVFAVQPELLFSTQGTKGEFEGFEASEEFEVNLSYINIPVMAKYYVSEGLSLQAGPQLGILIIDEDKEGESLEDVSTIDFGLNFGAGYQLESGLFFDARYNLGLSNVNDGDNSDDFDQKNRVIQISVGYKF